MMSLIYDEPTYFYLSLLEKILYFSNLVLIYSVFEQYEPEMKYTIQLLIQIHQY
jgi:hypothetical protein